MSTKMYCYRIRREHWWDFAKQVRTFYRTEGVFACVLENIGPVKVQKKWDDLIALANTLDNKDAVEIQLFEEPDGEHYLFRVLESGYLFMNKQKDQDWPIESVWYDDRTDIPPECKKNKEVAEWLDKMIHERKYFLYPILSSPDHFTLLVEYAASRVHQEQVVDS